MISVDQAVARIVAAFSPLPGERIAIGTAAGRVLAEDALAQASQPPSAVSSMDGYAVRAADAAWAGATLRVYKLGSTGHLSFIGDGPEVSRHTADGGTYVARVTGGTQSSATYTLTEQTTPGS